MKPRPGARATYTDTEWEFVRDTLRDLRGARGRSKLRPTTPKEEKVRAALESVLGNFVAISEDSGQIEAAWRRMAKHAAAIETELNALLSAGCWPKLLDPWRRSSRDAVEYATYMEQRARQRREFCRKPSGSNRARGFWVDALLGDLFYFWRACGGECSTSPTSDSTAFVIAAAAPVIDLKDSTVVWFVRTASQIHRGMPSCFYPLQPFEYPAIDVGGEMHISRLGIALAENEITIVEEAGISPPSALRSESPP
jgi:hypothetical protein